jgi:hypothetical protein
MGTKKSLIVALIPIIVGVAFCAGEWRALNIVKSTVTTDSLQLCDNYCNNKGEDYSKTLQMSYGTCICDNSEGRKVAEGYHEFINYECQGHPTKPRTHVKYPRFKIGDCVETYGSHTPFKIYQIMQDEGLEEDMYGVTLDASCKEEPKDWIKCDGIGSAYDIDIVDKNGKLVDCPK